MKSKFLIIVMFFAVSFFALAEMNVYIYKKDGTKDTYVASTVDSIGFVSTTGVENGHEWVDLGLPSGIKWATFNVGATSPEEYGDYFAWGEVEAKSDYSWRTYKWCNGSYTTITKYCTSFLVGSVDNMAKLELVDDAASVNWGGNWRMPTEAEQNELKNSSYTTWDWTILNEVEGYMITSKINGNSIFLPAAGYRTDSYLSYVGSFGGYWSSSLDTSRPYRANFMYFNLPNVSWYDTYRSDGRSIRAVLP